MLFKINLDEWFVMTCASFVHCFESKYSILTTEVAQNTKIVCVFVWYGKDPMKQVQIKINNIICDIKSANNTMWQTKFQKDYVK